MAYTFNTGVKSLALKYKNILGAKITDSSMAEAIEANPYYPSLYSLSNTFDKFRIENKAYKIKPTDFEELGIEVPFVVYAKIRDITDDFILITRKTEETLTYIYKDQAEKTITIKSFLSFDTNELMFRGVIWKAETNEHSVENGFQQKRKKENYRNSKWTIMLALLLLVFILLIGLSAPFSDLLSYSILMFCKLIGLTAVALLLIYDIDNKNPFVKNICSLSKKTDCNAVLNSKASKIFGVSLGDIGLFYFLSTILGLLHPIIGFSDKSSWLVLTNLVVMPFVLFSIYYQWKVVKQWCILCLVVQGVLISELIWGLLFAWNGNFSPSVFTSNLLNVIPIVFLPILIWYFVKPIMVKFQDHDKYLFAYKRLQHNPDIFKQLLHHQASAPPGWEKLGIDVGNPDAPNTIIKICNPYCGPCDIAHAKLEEAMHKNNSIKLKIIFITSNSEFDSGRSVVKHLMHIASKGADQVLKDALDDWYLGVDKNYDNFKLRHPIQETRFDREIIQIEEMSSWCRAAKVTHTPTIYVNGYLLPENYNILQLADLLSN
jgi:uncharacterized membrane protein